MENRGLSREHILALVQLGLSQRQARVYLSLLIGGTSTAKTLSKLSKVPRQDVYTIIPALEKIGLIEKTITKPTIFRAIPTQEGLDLLIKRKSAEYKEVMSKTRNLLKELKHYNKGPMYREEKTEFVLLPEMKERVLRIEEAISRSKLAVDSFTTFAILKQVISSSVGTLNRTLKRGIPVRFLVEEIKNETTRLEIPEAVSNNPHLEIRYARASVPAAAVLIDKKEVFFGTAIDFRNATYLWSNNQLLVGIVQNHFETIWNSLQK